MRYGRSRKPVGRLHEYAQNVNIYSYCVCVNSARVPSLLASACSDANTRVLGGFCNLLSYSGLAFSVAPSGFSASRKSLFGDAEEPFPHDDTAFPDVRKAHSGSAKRCLPHSDKRFSTVLTHMYSGFIQTFPFCRFCFADFFCQYFLLSELHIHAFRGGTGTGVWRLSQRVMAL